MPGRPARAAPYPWCAVSRGAGISYKNCSFPTFADCRAEILGLGGFCQPNPYYRGPLPAFEGVRRSPSRSYERPRW